ncbi:MAG TPA: response regulator transcription factor [Gemmatimonadales bacterium]|jgi:DNA-binding NarL/FixJ family response regulator|nr:response regulator transcription factor [Gemmatimonadales bacterium]
MHHTPIKVLVADDHTVVREGIRHVLDGEPGFTIVAEAATAADAVRLAESEKPDVVLLDITMPGESGLQAAARIRKLVPETRILILSMHDNPEYVLESVRAGAHGYLLKDSAATELRQAIRAVRQGEEYFSAPIAHRLRAAVRGQAGELPGPLDVLTGREREVLVGIALGRTNKEIATELGISHRTVETHRESLMRKLGIKTVAGLTKLALETGLVSR